MTHRRERLPPFPSAGARAGTFASALALLVVASCVRLNEPEHFTCKSDSDCLDSEVCRTHDGRALQCWPKGSCYSDGHCATDEACSPRTGRCEAVECTTRGDFCGEYRCDPTTYKCLDPCEQNADCIEDYRCSEGECIPFKRFGEACLDSEECPGQCCVQPETGEGACATTCFGDFAKRPLGATCGNDAVCFSGCCETKDEDEPYTCQRAQACIDEDQDCESDEQCRVGLCCPTPGTERTCQIGDACVLGKEGDECLKNEYCETGFCGFEGRCEIEPGTLGAACAQATECNAMLLCCSGPQGGATVCRRDCAPKLGDPCGGVEAERCPSPSDCNAFGNGTGFCSVGCTTSPQCGGPNSYGMQLRCVSRVQGFGMVCRPECDTDADCEQIRGGLVCQQRDSYRICDYN